MAFGDNNYSDIYKYLGNLTGQKEINKTSRLRDVYGGFKEGKKGGGFGFYDLFTPTGTGRVAGTIAKAIGFGGKSKRSDQNRNLISQAQKLVGQFENEFLKPSISSMHDTKRDIIRGTVRVNNESFRNILKQFEGARKSLKDMAGGGDIAGIGSRIKELGGLADQLKKELGGGRGGGPDISTQPTAGTQKIQIPNVDLGKPVLNLPISDYGAGDVGGFKSVKSEGHRFPVGTTQTPGGSKTNIRRMRLGENPGILT